METKERKRRPRFTPTSKKKYLKKISGKKVEMLEALHWLGLATSPVLKEFLRLKGYTCESHNTEIIRNFVHESNNEVGDYFIVRPREQLPKRKTDRMNYGTFAVHKLGPGGVQLLRNLSRYHPGIIHGGHWEHQLQQSTFLWEIFLGTMQNSLLTFKPHHQSSKDRDMPLAYDVPIPYDGRVIQTKLQPDGHFSINYGERTCNFFYECDRGTEQKEKVIRGKKTIERMILQYRAFIGSKDGDPLYHKYMAERGPALVLFHFSRKEKMLAAMELLHALTKGAGNNFMLFRSDEGRFGDDHFPPPPLSYANWHGPWERVGRPPLYIDTLQEKATA